ncbi:glycerol-3-phosphate dehydrogenase [Oceaniglobus ichthyenteri]|uniref:glycerol-3-phosphate dehydrogenase n=1 Tax=Oceaniglobus ichthyenteri TaxID=2136177 RepID=UPI000D3B62B7|nr:glycerol-3-phosphate dehydrogenase [Oceaniglobus ichthyenteri]
MTEGEDTCDLLVIGGGVNGCAIARDASGRGLSVVLAEMSDLASATSSASTKLFHGGLRYLEYFEFRLVRESLIERETLLRAMPHISWPMRFVLPLHPGMRFDSDTPTSRLMNIVMPWMRGRRPAWLIRLGLFLYDIMGGRQILPATSNVDLTHAPEGAPLRAELRRAYEYSDCWIEDSRLVVLTARDAEARGTRIFTRNRVVSAKEQDGGWCVTMRDTETGADRTVRARMVVNAAGPWVAHVLGSVVRSNSTDGVRLVRGSHIVTRRLFDHDKCYFFQGGDGRIVFAIPYETDFTLIGTTDLDHENPDIAPVCTPEEQQYLVNFVNGYLKQPISVDDIVWTYSGVRPLHEDGASSATAATRDYTLKIDRSLGAPVLNIFGGKITTHRRLAESALSLIGEEFKGLRGPWTAGVALPGGDFPVDGVPALIADLRAAHSFVDETWARRMIRAYGTEAREILAGADSKAAMGRDFGANLTEAEVIWLMDREYARTAEDVLWRRGKLGLRLTQDQATALDGYMAQRRAQRAQAAE